MIILLQTLILASIRESECVRARYEEDPIVRVLTQYHVTQTFASSVSKHNVDISKVLVELGITGLNHQTYLQYEADIGKLWQHEYLDPVYIPIYHEYTKQLKSTATPQYYMYEPLAPTSKCSCATLMPCNDISVPQTLYNTEMNGHEGTAPTCANKLAISCCCVRPFSEAISYDVYSLRQNHSCLNINNGQSYYIRGRYGVYKLLLNAASITTINNDATCIADGTLGTYGTDPLYILTTNNEYKTSIPKRNAGQLYDLFQCKRAPELTTLSEGIGVWDDTCTYIPPIGKTPVYDCPRNGTIQVKLSYDEIRIARAPDNVGAPGNWTAMVINVKSLTNGSSLITLHNCSNTNAVCTSAEIATYVNNTGFTYYNIRLNESIHVDEVNFTLLGQWNDITNTTSNISVVGCSTYKLETLWCTLPPVANRWKDMTVTHFENDVYIPPEPLTPTATYTPTAESQPTDNPKTISNILVILAAGIVALVVGIVVACYLGKHANMNIKKSLSEVHNTHELENIDINEHQPINASQVAQ